MKEAGNIVATIHDANDTDGGSGDDITDRDWEEAEVEEEGGELGEVRRRCLGVQES